MAANFRGPCQVYISCISPEEKREIDSAQHFIQVFDDLLQRARQGGGSVIELTRSAKRQAEDFRRFKLELIEKKLIGNLVLELTPTFINHTVNEIEKYLEIINYFLREGRLPEEMITEEHLLWLLDAKGHAGAINDGLDLTEQMLKERSLYFTEDFDNLFDKALEIKGYMRTSLKNFPALERLNSQTGKFMAFLESSLELQLDNKILGTLTPLILDHMLREECYYLVKLAQKTSVTRPACNPERPRIQELTTDYSLEDK